MKPITRLSLVLIVILTAVSLWAIVRRAQLASSTPAVNIKTTASVYETKENEGGNVTVSVTPLTLKPGFPSSFDIAFETHSVDLAFDVEQIATLRDETGMSYAPVWQGSPPGGHHRSGTLRFTPDLPKPTTAVLTLKNIAGIAERTFTWEVKNP